MSTNRTLIAERGRYGALLRSRAADDPELLGARARMQEEALASAINRALARLPR